jgi:hypothetical protein
MTATRYQRHPDLRLTALSGEGVVLHLGEKKYFSVNETGLTILQSLVQPRTFAELVDAILDEYEVQRDEAEQTTRAFLDRCLAARLIENLE